jgi:alkanesulfonate monooxygenase SsuD/methylene tetrahydromethanopterin reductase-like flavin-dependent oxidoreductase (luciferase family)
MLAATLPHVDAWNTWYADFGNSPERFAELNDQITAAAEAAGRDPSEVERSACVLVAVDGSVGERASTEAIAPLEGPADRIAAGLRELAEAGADEVIVVLDPITERSIRRLREVLALTRRDGGPADSDPPASSTPA